MIPCDCFPGFSAGTASMSVRVMPGRQKLHDDSLRTTTTGWTIEDYVPDRGRIIAAPGPVSLNISVDVGDEIVAEGFRPWLPSSYEYRTCQPANRWIAGVGEVVDEFNKLLRWEDITTAYSETGNGMVATLPLRVARGIDRQAPQFHYLTGRGWVPGNAVIIPSNAGVVGHPKAMDGDLPIAVVLIGVMDKAAQIADPRGIIEFGHGRYSLRMDMIEGRSIGLSTTDNAWSTWQSSGDAMFNGATGIVVGMTLWYGQRIDEAHGVVKEARTNVHYGLQVQPAAANTSQLTIWKPDWQGFRPTTLSIGSPAGAGMAVMEAAVFTGYDWRSVIRQSTQLVSYYMNRRNYDV